MSTIQLLIDIIDKTVTLDAYYDTSINQLKHLIHEKTNIPIDKQKLFYHNKPLINDNKTLKDYHIIDLSIITLHISLSNTSNPTPTRTPSNSINLHTILPLIKTDENPYNIFRCDLKKPLIQIIQESKIMTSPPKILDCKISITTLDTDPNEIILNHNQIHLEPLHKIHHSIRPHDGVKVYIEYENKYLYLIPQQYTNKNIDEKTTYNITRALLKDIAELIKTTKDYNLLKMVTNFVVNLYGFCCRSNDIRNPGRSRTKGNFLFIICFYDTFVYCTQH